MARAAAAASLTLTAELTAMMLSMCTHLSQAAPQAPVRRGSEPGRLDSAVQQERELQGLRGLRTGSYLR